MGMSYDELSMYGRLRKVDKLGPYSMVRTARACLFRFCVFNSDFKRLQPPTPLLKPKHLKQWKVLTQAILVAKAPPRMGPFPLPARNIREDETLLYIL